ncbi:MAG TPA: VOC family protein [Thermoanaerobaculia bacterium]|nr:VOC family protein [Thermoanaerobaculia bacterium]
MTAAGAGTAADPAALGPLGQIAVTVGDLDAMVAFYRDVLGLRFLFAAPPQMAFFDLGGVRLLLGRGQPGHAEHRGSILYFRVGSIDAAHRRLADHGVAFHQPPRKAHEDPRHELWLASFPDPEGNMIELMEERAKPSAG